MSWSNSAACALRIRAHKSPGFAGLARRLPLGRLKKRTRCSGVKDLPLFCSGTWHLKGQFDFCRCWWWEVHKLKKKKKGYLWNHSKKILRKSFALGTISRKSLKTFQMCSFNLWNREHPRAVPRNHLESFRLLMSTPRHSRDPDWSGLSRAFGFWKALQKTRVHSQAGNCCSKAYLLGAWLICGPAAAASRGSYSEMQNVGPDTLNQSAF